MREGNDDLVGRLHPLVEVIGRPAHGGGSHPAANDRTSPGSRELARGALGANATDPIGAHPAIELVGGQCAKTGEGTAQRAGVPGRGVRGLREYARGSVTKRVHLMSRSCLGK